MNSIRVGDARITLESSDVGRSYLIIDDMSRGGETALALFVDRIVINEVELACDHEGHNPDASVYPKKSKKPKLYGTGQPQNFLHRCPACGQTQRV